MTGWIAIVLLVGLPARAEEPTITLGTYNTGLAYGFVDDAKQRRGPILDALHTVDADVLCLEEVWEPGDRRKVAHDLDDTFATVIAPPILQTRTQRLPACKRKELFGEDRFVSCLTGECGGTSGDEQTNCVIEHCGPRLEALKDENPECGAALMSQVGKSGLTALINVLNPFARPGIYAYDGSDGLVMLAREPIRHSGLVDFSDIASLNRRHAIWGEITVGDERVRVYCTHLTSDLSNIAPYPGAAASWGAENESQIERLIAHADAWGGPAVMMGDFNCGWGDEGAGLDAELESSCEVMREAGFVSPMVSEDPVCTFCAANPINVGAGEDKNVLIDHVFLRGLTGVESRRIFDGEITIRVKGKDKVTALSDHYGAVVEAKLGAPPPAGP